MKDREEHLENFKKIFPVPFCDPSLLQRSLLHRSYSNEKGLKCNNENLEFLGDSVLSLVIVDYLYRNFPKKKEGELAKIKSYIVSEVTLSDISKRIGIDNLILLSKGEELSGGRQKKAMLADCFEAILGAYYMDRGFENAKVFIMKLFKEEVEKAFQDKYLKNYKTLLQELVQKNYKCCPEYKLEKTEGPDHKKTFLTQVFIEGKNYGSGRGSSKKDAEQEAAKHTYNYFTKNHENKRVENE